MSKFTSRVASDFILNSQGIEYYFSIGSAIKATVAGPYRPFVAEGFVSGFSIKPKHSISHISTILDGVPTSKFETDDKANLKDLNLSYEVDKIEVEIVENDEVKYIVIDASKITELGGELIGADGSAITVVEDSATAAEAINAESEDPITVVAGDVTIEEEIVPKSDLKVAGANAGIKQNHAQEVE
jgi:hypothetical protein